MKKQITKKHIYLDAHDSQGWIKVLKKARELDEAKEKNRTIDVKKALKNFARLHPMERLAEVIRAYESGWLRSNEMIEEIKKIIKLPKKYLVNGNM